MLCTNNFSATRLLGFLQSYRNFPRKAGFLHATCPERSRGVPHATPTLPAGGQATTAAYYRFFTGRSAAFTAAPGVKFTGRPGATHGRSRYAGRNPMLHAPCPLPYAISGTKVHKRILGAIYCFPVE